MFTDQILALKTAMVIFAIVCFFHIFRIIFRVRVTFGKFVLPLRTSYAAVPVSALLCFWMFSALK